ncbi:MAG: HAD family phosphatase [Saccharofermentans sp.]|nr:HAD family phosphatase [Saccharofermentans sp.]
MTVKAVVFDMDGIIFDTEKAVIEVWKEVALKHGIPNIEEFCVECIGTNATMTRSIFYKRYGDKYLYDDIRAEKTGIIRERFKRGEIDIKIGAENILSTLKSRGIKVALASSTREEVVREELTLTGLIKYFDEIVTGDMVSNSKPAPDIFLKACEKLGVNPEEAVGIEDSFNGIRSSHAAGLYTIMIPDLLQPDEEISGLADIVLPDLNEALKVILDRV